jgi:hypothetical protein
LADQQRLRDNIKALTSTPGQAADCALHRESGDQETRLEQLTKDKQAAGSERTIAGRIEQWFAFGRRSLRRKKEQGEVPGPELL